MTYARASESIVVACSGVVRGVISWRRRCARVADDDHDRCGARCGVEGGARRRQRDGGSDDGRDDLDAHLDGNGGEQLSARRAAGLTAGAVSRGVGCAATRARAVFGGALRGAGSFVHPEGMCGRLEVGVHAGAPCEAVESALSPHAAVLAALSLAILRGASRGPRCRSAGDAGSTSRASTRRWPAGTRRSSPTPRRRMSHRDGACSGSATVCERGVDPVDRSNTEPSADRLVLASCRGCQCSSGDCANRRPTVPPGQEDPR